MAAKSLETREQQPGELTRRTSKRPLWIVGAFVALAVVISATAIITMNLTRRRAEVTAGKGSNVVAESGKNSPYVNAGQSQAPAQSTANDSAATPVGSDPPGTPDELVRQFYSWYLGELRAGKEPFKQEEKMKQYVTDAYMRQLAADKLANFDPALGLPKPESDWYNMKVEVAKPEFFKRKGLHDAYVEVKYKGFTDRAAATRQGTRFVSIDDEWVIGLQRTGAGWRIASIGVKE